MLHTKPNKSVFYDLLGFILLKIFV
jgi:hypothetical protein